jgi:hypothetical protein
MHELIVTRSDNVLRSTAEPQLRSVAIFACDKFRRCIRLILVRSSPEQVSAVKGYTTQIEGSGVLN